MPAAHARLSRARSQFGELRPAGIDLVVRAAVRTTRDLLSADGAQPGAVLAAQRRHGHRHRPILLHWFFQVEHMTRVDAIRLLASFRRVQVAPRYHVNRRHILLFKRYEHGYLDRPQATAAFGLERTAHLAPHEDAVGSAVHAHVPGEAMTLAIDLRVIIDDVLAHRAGVLLKERGDVELHDSASLNWGYLSLPAARRKNQSVAAV